MNMTSRPTKSDASAPRWLPTSMKKTLMVSVFLSLLLAAQISTACSTDGNYKARFERAARKMDMAPKPPVASIDKIIRGGHTPGWSCNDVAIIKIKIPVQKDNPAYAYRFKLVSGKLPRDAFEKYPVLGEEHGEYETFIFSWIEKSPSPFNIRLSITAYSKGGRRGGTALLDVSDNGL